ncbi:MAG TPA: glycerol-3-phosphate acyltransferase [Hyphomicrobiaceae bacterium]|nr:glycerol-3-phosphate acyltransferase [Hyphomicrobiaceae bacterium]
MGLIFSVYGLLALVAGYLLGSIPFGLILTKAAGLGDVRNIGSGNIGATNVLRTGNKSLAAATLLLDALKGTIAVLLVYDIAVRWAGFNAITYCHIAGLGAFLGHIYPVWLRFQGGKGVATYIGVLIGMHWPAALWFGIIWIGVALGTRYSSLAALCGVERRLRQRRRRQPRAHVMTGRRSCSPGPPAGGGCWRDA